MESPRRKSARNEAPACPICGRCFPADEIEAHAAECAARAFGEDEPAQEPPPEAPHPDEAEPRRRRRRTDRARVPVNTQYDKHLPSARSRAVARSAPAHGRTWAVPGGEAAQLRGGAVIYAAELPEHLQARVDAADDALALLAPEAVSFTNSRGALDKRKTEEYRRRVQEEEYQLELYRSTMGASKKADVQEPPEPQLSLRIAFDSEGTASAVKVEPKPRPSVTSPREAAAAARARRRGRDIQAARERERRRRDVRNSARPTSNEQALEYVGRMRKILPERTVATFVELLRAYKRKTFPAMDVAERVASLLKGYPELIRDFEHFLPARDASRDFLRSAAARDPGIAETEPPSEFTQMWSERAAGSQPDLTLLAHDDVEAPPTDPVGDAAAAAVAADAGAEPPTKRRKAETVHATWRAAWADYKAATEGDSDRTQVAEAARRVVAASQAIAQVQGSAVVLPPEVAPPPPPALIHGASQNPWAPPMGHIHGPEATPPVTQQPMLNAIGPPMMAAVAAAAALQAGAGPLPSQATPWKLPIPSVTPPEQPDYEAPPSISEGDGGFCDGKGDLDVDATSDEEESDAEPVFAAPERSLEDPVDGAGPLLLKGVVETDDRLQRRHAQLVAQVTGRRAPPYGSQIPTAPRPPPRVDDMRVGRWVEVWWPGPGAWYLGRIVAEGAGTLKIAYTDGQTHDQKFQDHAFRGVGPPPAEMMGDAATWRFAKGPARGPGRPVAPAAVPMEVSA